MTFIKLVFNLLPGTSNYGIEESSDFVYKSTKTKDKCGIKFDTDLTAILKQFLKGIIIIIKVLP